MEHIPSFSLPVSSQTPQPEEPKDLPTLWPDLSEFIGTFLQDLLYNLSLDCSNRYRFGQETYIAALAIKGACFEASEFLRQTHSTHTNETRG
jgi:hypothetical protein